MQQTEASAGTPFTSGFYCLSERTA